MSRQKAQLFCPFCLDIVRIATSGYGDSFMEHALEVENLCSTDIDSDLDEGDDIRYPCGNYRINVAGELQGIPSLVIYSYINKTLNKKLKKKSHCWRPLLLKPNAKLTAVKHIKRSHY